MPFPPLIKNKSSIFSVSPDERMGKIETNEVDLDDYQEETDENSEATRAGGTLAALFALIDLFNFENPNSKRTGKQQA